MKKKTLFSLSTLAVVALVLASLYGKQALSSATPAKPAEEKAKVIVQELQPADDTRRLLVPVKVEAKVARCRVV